MTTPAKSAPELHRENSDLDWIFLFKEKCSRILDKSWEAVMLYYELCRELSQSSDPKPDHLQSLTQISNGRFPDTPFLALEEREQQAILDGMERNGSPFERLRRFSTRSIFNYRIAPAHKDWLVNHLENVEMEAASIEASKHEGLEPEDFLPMSCPGARASSEELNSLIEKGKKENLFDYTGWTVTLHLDSTFHVSEIVEEFKQVLEQIKELNFSRSGPSGDPRGKPKDPHSYLKCLGAFRLKRLVGSFEKIEEFLEKNHYPDLRIQKAGWNKNVKRGGELIDNFKSWVSHKAEDGSALVPFRPKTPRKTSQ
jgi:hypothetical protein